MKKLFYILFLSIPLTITGQFSMSDSSQLTSTTSASTAGEFKNSFTYVLNKASKTSAAVYDSATGVLIRTLWNNESFSEGAHTSFWDGLTDEGEVAPEGKYIAKVLSNNLTFTWKNIIGNTSDSLYGSSVYHQASGFFWDLAIGKQYAYFCTGYTEDQAGSSTNKFLLTDAGKTINVLSKGADVKSVDVDNDNVYWVGIDAGYGHRAFVFATRQSDDSEVIFPLGKTYKTRYGMTYKSLIYLDSMLDGSLVTPLGVAVQKTGSYIFAGIRNKNRIYVVNKTTGLVLSQSTVGSPTRLTTEGNSALWVISDADSSVNKLLVNSDGSLGSIQLKIKNNLSFPASITIQNDTAIIVDAGINHQVRYFDKNTGAYLGAFGQQGGYLKNATVTNDKFLIMEPKKMFRVATTGDLNALPLTFIKYQADGSFWLGDEGNLRTMHFTGNRTFINHIQQMGFTYSAAVDANNPRRVFSNYLEFDVDYTTGKWTFVKNWTGGVYGLNDNQYNRLQNVTTLSNGKTYFLTNYKINATTSNIQLAELVEGGTIRYTNVSVGANNTGMRYVLHPNGDLETITDFALGMPAVWQRRKLLSFDIKGDPVYGPQYKFATSGASLTGKDPVTTNGISSLIPNSYMPSTGNVIAWNPNAPYNHGSLPGVVATRSIGAHLGAVNVATNKWVWKTSYITDRYYNGPYPDDGSFDAGNGIHNAGSFATIADKYIVWGYKGEFWKASQTNMYNLFYENGLMLGQFGVTGPDIIAAYPNVKSGYPMMAGNAAIGLLTKVGNKLYLYHGDEFQHGGVHQWEIAGLETIKDTTVPISPTFYNKSDGIDLFAGLPRFDTVENNTAGWTRNVPKNGAFGKGNYEVRTGNITYKNGNNDIYVKLGTSATDSLAHLIVSRDLGVAAAPAGWAITGRLIYPLESDLDTNLLQILDRKDKKIVEIRRGEIIYTVNNQTFFNGRQQTVAGTNKDRPFSIVATPTGTITFTYGIGGSINVKPLDPTADIKDPGTFKIYMADRNKRGHVVNISNLRFFLY